MSEIVPTNEVIRPGAAPPVAPYALRGWKRRAVVGLLDAMRPRWPEFDEDIDSAAIARIERDLGRFPRRARFVVFAALFLLEFGACLFRAGWFRTSGLPRDARQRRLSRMAATSSAALRGGYAAWRTHILLTCYSDPSVELFLGVDSRRWARNRRQLRARLLLSHPPRAAPPAALIDAHDAVPGMLEPAFTEGET